MAKENALQAKLRALEKIISLMPGHIYWKDVNGIYLGCNDNHAKSLGFNSTDEIVGKTDYDLPWKEQADELIRLDKKVIATREPHTTEEFVVFPNGKKATFLSQKQPLYNENNAVIGILGVSFDITDRKEMENDLIQAKRAAEAANKVKSAFIANLSHDARTPLTGIVGIAKLLESEGGSTKDREYATIIHQSSEKLLLLLNDILEIVSAEEIKEESIKKEVISLSERMDQIADIFTPNAEIKEIAFQVEMDRNIPPYVISDRIKIDRILLNLVSNALKFTETGQITLSLNMLEHNNDEGIFELAVSDTGVGISEDKAPHIFDRFYKVTPSYEGKYTGFGIGLFIVKRYVELLKGHITVTSTPGKGTVFKVTLPLKIAKAEDIAQQGVLPPLSTPKHLLKTPTSVKEKNAPYQTNTLLKKVLVIEDDLVAKRIAKTSLQSAGGFEVDEAGSAEEGLKVVMEKPYDLIITDIGLPGMDGKQFAFLERSWEKITQRAPIPIVGLSARNYGKTEEETGIDLWLMKPLNVDKINEIKLKFFTDSAAETLEENIPQKNVPCGLGLDLPATEGELFELERYPLFDEEEGIKNNMGDPNLLKELLDMVIQTMPDELALLNKAHDSLDWEQIGKMAHKLKGAALYCGTIRMRYACQYMERYLLAGHTKLCEKLYFQLNQVLENTLQYIKGYRSSQ
jgi:two-component system aerobic respiration control sensor histidine kinase ArcB